MFSRKWMGTFEGLCRNPAKSKMAGSNWLQTDEAVDVILCDLHVKKGFRSNPRCVKVELRCKNAGSCLVGGQKKTWPWLLTVMSCFIVPSSTIKVHHIVVQCECERGAYSVFLKQGGSDRENILKVLKSRSYAMHFLSPALFLLYWAQLGIGWSHFCIVILCSAQRAWAADGSLLLQIGSLEVLHLRSMNGWAQ